MYLAQGYINILTALAGIEPTTFWLKHNRIPRSHSQRVFSSDNLCLSVHHLSGDNIVLIVEALSFVKAETLNMSIRAGEALISLHHKNPSNSCFLIKYLLCTYFLYANKTPSVAEISRLNWAIRTLLGPELDVK